MELKEKVNMLEYILHWELIIMVGGVKVKLNCIWMEIPNSLRYAVQVQKIISADHMILIPTRKTLKELRNLHTLNFVLPTQDWSRLSEVMVITMLALFDL